MGIKLTSVRSKYLTGAKSALVDDDIYKDIKSALIDCDEKVIKESDGVDDKPECLHDDNVEMQSDIKIVPNINRNETKELEDIFDEALYRRARFLK